jgi:hypothetical protein
LKADIRASSETCRKIPYAIEQGNILEEPEIPAEEHGILLATTKIDPG